MVMIDASHIKVHQHSAGAQGGNQAMGRTKRGSTPRYIWPWMRMVCRSECLTEATPADCSQAAKLIEGIDAEHLLADKGYDVDAFIKLATLAGMSVVIPPKRNRKVQRDYDKDLYKLRHLLSKTHF
jgi:IS5 family transposase